MSGNTYKMNLSKLYEVTFIKDGAKFKKGEKTKVNMPIASKFFAQGKIKATDELLSDAKKYKCTELFKEK